MLGTGSASLLSTLPGLVFRGLERRGRLGAGPRCRPQLLYLTQNLQPGLLWENRGQGRGLAKLPRAL